MYYAAASATLTDQWFKANNIIASNAERQPRAPNMFNMLCPMASSIRRNPNQKEFIMSLRFLFPCCPGVDRSWAIGPASFILSFFVYVIFLLCVYVLVPACVRISTCVRGNKEAYGALRYHQQKLDQMIDEKQTMIKESKKLQAELKKARLQIEDSESPLRSIPFMVHKHV